ncbi:MAG: epoxyqueuosine reductase QueH [Bacillota bacterium]|nr:epoxyqueuosine reductase QueH [Bacillota bacterium]
MRILLHTCCGPCSTYVAKALHESGHDVTGYFYNPNIHPYTEYLKRKENAEKWAQAAGVPLLVDSGYDVAAWMGEVYKDLPNRCEGCYRSRLDPAAKIAKQQSFDAFTTTLLISPYQQHEKIRQVGEEVAEAMHIPFFYEDFRPHFNETYGLSREYDLYRQHYCGCVFSEYERAQEREQKAKKRAQST